MEKVFAKFHRWHYDWLSTSPRPEGGSVLPVSDTILAQLEAENSWTCLVDGEPVACGGIVKMWPGRSQAWAYFGRNTLRLMPWITAEVKKILETVKGRIEFTVRQDFLAGQRWAKELGFEVETPCLRQFGLAGENHVGFVKVS